MQQIKPRTFWSLFAGLTSAQVAQWGQCGGIGYTGSTTCVSGTVCTYVNDYYSQCLSSSTTSSSTTSTSKATTTTTSTAVVSSTARCTPASGSSDDTPAIASAIAACPSGTIVIPQGKTYNIGSQLLWTGCKGCALQIDGTLLVSTNFTYWNGKGEVFHISGITDPTIFSSTGTGLVDGQGQASWDHYASDNTYSRPYLFRVDGTTGLKMYNLAIHNAPKFHVVTSGNSKDITYSDITLYSVTTSNNAASNTDGFDIGPASYVTLSNIHVTNSDDCIVLKPGADHVTASDITCVGSHGLSVGSLGSSYGSNDTVTNSIFQRATMTGSTKASGIKVYPAGPSHGSATVGNVTWKDIYCDSCQYAMQIQTCYGETTAYCSQYPSTAHLSGIVWNNITGTTSGKYGSVVANMDCPAAGTCGITVQNMAVKAANGAQQVLCANTPSSIGVTCTSGASG